MNPQPQPQPERDAALASLLTDLDVDQPGPDFWTQLDASLAAADQRSGPAADEGSGLAADDGGFEPMVLNGSRPAAAGVVTALPQTNRGSSDRSRRLRTRIGVGVLGLAAAIVVAVVASSAFRSDRVTTEGPANDGAPADAPGGSAENGTGETGDAGDTESEGQSTGESGDSVLSSGQPDHAAPDGPFHIGPGHALAFAPDGQGVLALAPAVDGQGTDLIVYPFADGPAPLALPAGVTLSESVMAGDFAIGRGGHVGWIEDCPGQSCTLSRGVLQPDGTITDLVTVTNPELPAVTQSVMAADGLWWLATDAGIGALTPDLESGATIASEQARRAVGIIADPEGEALIWIEDGTLRTENTVLATGLSDVDTIAFASEVVVGLNTVDGDLTVVDLETGDVIRDLGGQLNSVVVTAEVTAVLESGSILFEDSSGGDLSTVGGAGQPTDGLFSPDRTRFVYTDVSADDGPAVRFIQFARGTTSLDGPGPTERPFPSRAVDLGSADVGCCEARQNNVAIAVEAIDGLVIPDGASLSLNEVLGPRTEAAGYQVGGSVVDGLLQEQRGAGVGAVATALYRAAVGAGLDIEEHQSRALFIADGPYGLDATIAWPELDLVIGNRTGTDVWITAWSEDGTVSIQLEIDPDADPVIVELADNEANDVDGCTEVTTSRSRTFTDGRVEQDRLRAVYLPGEGLNCDGSIRSPGG